MVAIVVAYSANRVIGVDGGLPWHLPTDMAYFRELTTGGTVLMGRRTYESIPERFRPLPGRRNLVLSSGPPVDGAETFATLDAALDACERDCFVIGGGAVYRDALALSDRVYATEVHDTVDGDTYFPELDAAWTRTVASDPVTENGHTLQFCTYDRAG
jgi:dihydrofolate reductase